MQLKSFSEFLAEQNSIEPIIENLTYEGYCEVLDHVFLNERLDETIVDFCKLEFTRLCADFKADIERIIKEFHISGLMIVRAFKHPTMFSVLRVFKFNLYALWDSLSHLTDLIRKGLYDTMDELGKTGVMQKLDKGMISLDEVLEKHPILKFMTGPILAASMVFMWLNMTFIGNFKYDMNLTKIVDAIKGKYTIKDFLTSVEGRSMVALFAMGTVGSFIWLGSNILNLILALLNTGFLLIKETELAKTIRSKLNIR
jgi:heme exporter protein D